MPLVMGDPVVDVKGSASLKSMKKFRATNDGSLERAIESAAYYAKKMAKTMFVYGGNSFGRGVWRVSDKRSDYLNGINNTVDRMVSVTPDSTMSWHTVTWATKTA